MKKYTTKGSVRGTCGHTHTILNAHKCATLDQANCAKVGGYSDRNVHVVLQSGHTVPISHEEWEELHELLNREEW